MLWLLNELRVLLCVMSQLVPIVAVARLLTRELVLIGKFG